MPRNFNYDDLDIFLGPKDFFEYFNSAGIRIFRLAERKDREVNNRCVLCEFHEEHSQARSIGSARQLP